VNKIQGVFNNMKNLSILSAATVATTTMFLSLSPSVFATEIHPVIGTDTSTIKTDETIVSFIEKGESPPIDKLTNLPVMMTAVSLEEPEDVNKYVVQEGDTLSKIASEFVLDVDTLIKWNNLVNDTILVGQTLSVNGQVELTAEQIAALEAEQRRRTQVLEQAQARAHARAQAQVQQNQNNSEQVTNAPAESAATADASNLIAIAHQYLGAPYVYAGKTPSGFDCSGYVSYVFKQVGKLNSYYSTSGLYSIAQKVSTPQVGDLVFFSGTYRAGISHVGIYIGNNQMINASGNRVQINNIYDSYWGKHFTGFGRM